MTLFYDTEIDDWNCYHNVLWQNYTLKTGSTLYPLSTIHYILRNYSLYPFSPTPTST